MLVLRLNEGVCGSRVSGMVMSLNRVAQQYDETHIGVGKNGEVHIAIREAVDLVYNEDLGSLGECGFPS